MYRKFVLFRSCIKYWLTRRTRHRKIPSSNNPVTRISVFRILALPQNGRTTRPSPHSLGSMRACSRVFGSDMINDEYLAISVTGAWCHSHRWPARERIPWDPQMSCQAWSRRLAKIRPGAGTARRNTLIASPLSSVSPPSHFSSLSLTSFRQYIYFVCLYIRKYMYLTYTSKFSFVNSSSSLTKPRL